jgi:hypothetical protein
VGSARGGLGLRGGDGCCRVGDACDEFRCSSCRCTAWRHRIWSCYIAKCSPCSVFIAAPYCTIGAPECCCSSSEIESGAIYVSHTILFFLAPRATVDNYNLGLSECINVKMSLLVWLFYYQAKIPDEVIAREIVINDADPSVRYKLTKRQTQEEVNP